MAIGSDEEKIVFNGKLLTGIQDLSFVQNVSESPVLSLGKQTITTQITAPTTFSVNVSKLLLNTDFLRTLTGSTTISGQFQYGENYLAYATQVIFFAFLVSLSSITFWTFVGKYLRKFATNEKFIKYFNCVMSVLLLLSIITFYI